MASVKSSNSSSVTSTDSWTLIDENQPEPNLPSAPSPEHAEDPIEPPEEPSETGPPKTRSNGFLSFDEFLQERMLEHDYEQDNKIEKLKTIPNLPKEIRKCKAKNVGTVVFIGLLVVMSGLATLCSILTVPYYAKEIQKEPEFAIINTPIAPLPAPPAPVVSSIPSVFVQPDEEIRIVEDSHPPLRYVNGTLSNSEEDYCYEDTEPIIVEEVEREVPSETFEKIPETMSFEELYRNHLRSRLRLLRRVLNESNLQALFSFIMINLYLFTLIATLYRHHQFASLKKLENQTVEDAEVRENILKQLPFWGQDMEKSARVSKRNKLEKLRKIQGQKRYDSKDFREQILESLKLLTKVMKPQDEAKPEEPNMKTKKHSVCQIQRDRIKLLKAKFTNEMSQIRERHVDEAARMDAMHMTSQKFMMKLKNNRDKYLLELRKVKEARQAREGQTRKDASVGSYAVAMPVGYSFLEKLGMLREKENEKRKEMAKAAAGNKTIKSH